MKFFKVDEKKLESIVKESISDQEIMIMRIKQYIIDIELEHKMEEIDRSNKSFNEGLDKGIEKGIEIYKSKK